VQEATQAAIAAPSNEQIAETPADRAEARRQAKAQSAKARTRRGFVSTERTEGLRRFWRETMAEIRKVVWPDRETTRNLTLLVIALSVVLGILLGSLDWVLFQIFEAF
ncbi:MAG: preprotein translocase subunit SecE, partial [Chloroflexota bacterium]|nr:preprotein translocase subunit SecE [Chloroflexota bacterium]